LKNRQEISTFIILGEEEQREKQQEERGTNWPKLQDSSKKKKKSAIDREKSFGGRRAEEAFETRQEPKHSPTGRTSESQIKP